MQKKLYLGVTCSVILYRTAPIPKYLKVHYVKEEIGDGKGVFVCKHEMRLKHVNLTGTESLLLFPLLSLPRHHLPAAGPSRVCVLPWHLCLSPTPGGPMLGQTLPAAPWGPGADCQESGHLELWGGQTCLHTHTAPTHEKQTFTHHILKGCCCSGKLQEYSGFCCSLFLPDG